MRASPRISVLGEGGDPCTAGNGPLKDHKTVIFPRDGFPFHWRLLMCVILTTVAGLASDTFLLQQETVFCGDPLISENRDPPFSDSFRKTLFAKTATHSAWPVTQSALYYYSIRSQHDSFRKLIPQDSFRKTLSANCLKLNPGIVGLHSSSSSIKMIMMTLLLLIMSFFLKSITRAWSLL